VRRPGHLVIPRHDGGMNEVENVLGPDGLLAAALPGYEARPCQLQLANVIEKVFAAGGRLLAEAGTGTGKSLAYLTPAADRARRGEVTVVVTAGIALQEQLMVKDVPLLKRATGWQFDAVLAKGHSNYLCVDRLQESRTGLLVGKALHPNVRWAELQRWADSTVEGDVSELPFVLNAEEREVCTCSSEDCIGQKCPSYGGCFVLKIRARIHAAKLVVCNYHLYFADLSIKVQTGDPTKGVLPAHDHLVWDEGHRAADVARDFFGIRVTGYGVKRSVARLEDKSLKSTVLGLADDYFGGLLELRRTKDYGPRLLGGEPELDSARLEDALRRAAVSLHQQPAKDQKDAARAEKASERCSRTAESLGTMRTQSAKKHAYFIDEQGGRAAACAKPIAVDEALEACVFGEHGPASVVVTSATLASGRGDFSYVERELGAFEPETFVAESPFDFTTNALLVVPDDAVEPNDKRFADYVGRTLERVVAEARGGVLALFTSYRVLEVAHTQLMRGGMSKRYTVLKQGEAPRTQLVERFRQDGHAVLLGTDSLWEGVDVQGQACRVVFIDRLPFDNPSDPVIDAISEADRGAFKNVLLPRAIIGFRQGVGRLIRSRTDRGVIVCCDGRVYSKGYGSRFVRALPAGLPVSRDLGAVGRFFGGSGLMETRVSIRGGGGVSAA
jgi:ATP-dependent DNA helicase DinG